MHFSFLSYLDEEKIDKINIQKRLEKECSVEKSSDVKLEKPTYVQRAKRALKIEKKMHPSGALTIRQRLFTTHSFFS